MSLSVPPPKAKMTGSSEQPVSWTARACTSCHQFTAKGPYQPKFCDGPVCAHPSLQANPVPKLCGGAIPCKGKAGFAGESMNYVRCRMEGTDSESQYEQGDEGSRYKMHRSRGAASQPGLASFCMIIFTESPHTRKPHYLAVWAVAAPLLCPRAWEPVLPRHRNLLMMSLVSPPHVYPAPVPARGILWALCSHQSSGVLNSLLQRRFH